MITVFEILLMVCAVLAFIASYGLHDTKQRTLSICESVALFVILAAFIGVHA